MVSFQRAVSLLLFIALAQGAVAAPKWLKAESQDIVILSDLNRKDLSDIAVKYAAFRYTLRQLLADPGQKLPPSVLIVFRNSSKLEELLSDKNDPNTKLISSWTVVDETTVMAMTFEGDRDNTLSLGFEFEAVSVLNRLGYFLPLWMSQGTGEVFASAELKKDRCIVGEDNDRVYRTWADGSELEWKHFFAMSTASPDYAGKQAHGEYQAQAWALMHTILLQPPGDLHTRFVQSARIARDNPMGGVAAQAMLGTTYSKFDTVIQTHLRHDHTIEVPIDAAALRASIKITDAPEAEVRVRTADILASRKKDWLVFAELSRANELAPNTPLVDEALARSALADGHEDRALELYRKAIDEGSQNDVAYVRSAMARINESSNGNIDHEGDGGTNIPPAIDELHRALKINPSNRQAWELLARAYFLKNKAEPGDGDDLAPGLSNDEDGMALRYRRALIYNRLDRLDLVAADVAVIRSSPIASERLKATAGNLLNNLEYQRDRASVAKLVEAHDYPAAIDVIDEGEKKLTGAGYAELYAKMRRSLVEMQECKVVFDSLRERKEDFKVLAAAFVAKYPNDPNVPRLAEELGQPSDGPRVMPDTSPAPPSKGLGSAEISSTVRIPPQYQRYVQAMEAKVETTWLNLLDKANAQGLSGMDVTCIFTLNARGEVVKVARMKGTGSDEAYNYCERAITEAGPFDSWSAEMAEALGDEQRFVLKFSFE